MFMMMMTTIYCSSLTAVQSVEFYREQFSFKLLYYHIATHFVKFTNFTAVSIDLFTVYAG